MLEGQKQSMWRKQTAKQTGSATCLFSTDDIARKGSVKQPQNGAVAEMTLQR
jgi:hypothetical protein